MFMCKKIGWLVIVAVILTVVVTQICYGQEAEEPAPEEKKEETKGMTLWQTCVAGGWTMIFIGLCSVVSMWFIIEYYVKMSIKKIIPGNFINWAYNAFQQKQYNEVYEYCKAHRGILYNIVIAMLEKIDHGMERIQEAITDSTEKEEAALQRKNAYLSIVATVSPMLGLLGTVLGMIQAFNVIAFEAGLGKPTLLAAGVSKALITTAAGLIVAIPAMGFYFFFHNRNLLIMEKIEAIMTNFLSILRGETIVSTPAEQPVQEVAQLQQEIYTPQGESK